MYTMPVKAIKNILRKEIDSHANNLYQLAHKGCVPDTQNEMIYIAKTILLDRLETCLTYEALEEFLSFSGYRMSMQDWINSL